MVFASGKKRQRRRKAIKVRIPAILKPDKCTLGS
jgi:hypothetical protein